MFKAIFPKLTFWFLKNLMLKALPSKLTSWFSKILTFEALLPKLTFWFLKNLFFYSVVSFCIVYFVFTIFLDKSALDFYLIFYSLMLSFIIFTLLFMRLLYPLSQMAKKIESLAKLQKDSHNHEDFFLKEAGEFYNINKNINIISKNLDWQEVVINQESSELDAIISAVTGPILAIDRNKKVLFFNNEAVNLFEMYQTNHSLKTNKLDDSKEIYLSEVIRNPQILDMYNECLHAATVIKKNIEMKSVFSAEKELIYEVTVAPLEKRHNKPTGAVALFYNITNIKKTERMQTDFISNVSHELRTPLTAVQGYVQNLLDNLNQNSKDQTEQFLKVIDRNVKRLVSLLNHFLELSYIDSQTNFKKENLSTEKITHSIVKDLHVKDREIKYDFSAKTVQADQHFLKQVLYNLLDNAIKYTPKSCLIEVIWSENQKEEIVLTVRDHGKGIPISKQERMFERFYRADPSRNKVRGAGLGLSIVKQLINKHGGKIQLISDGNQGSSFICTFPYDKNEEE